MSAGSIGLIAFTERGLALAERLAKDLRAAGDDARATRGFGAGRVSLAAWTREAFETADALVFVGACGIAVRAVAPYAASKASDPAVVVVDEGGRWAISLLSGHLGGANDLARRLAAICGAEPVVTTATDGRGVWAVDEWARRHGMGLLGAGAIKAVSGALLAGRSVRLESAVPLAAGRLPAGIVLAGEGEDAGAAMPGETATPGEAMPKEAATPAETVPTETATPAEEAIARSIPTCVISPFARDLTARTVQLVPRCVLAGIGCRRGTSAAAISSVFDAALARSRVLPAAIAGAASIDVKRDEAGLAAFCRERGFPLAFLSARDLERVSGSVSPSAFVAKTVGVDNVCERAALSRGGRLLLPKFARDGVTVALALLSDEYDLND